ncbi:hypothetical protein [Salininema proteolyticum]|uniref:Uncharacterized protein n=1 Tax=Salininema proteolyticum TaxID=1607685 RepID=A0ABV8U3E5_9ACTN
MTEHKEYYVKTMKAFALDKPEYAELVANQPVGSNWGLYSLATFSVMLDKAFKDQETVTHESIKQFVEKVRYSYRKAEKPFNGLALEGLIRSLMGEDELMDDIPVDQQHDAIMLTIYYVAQTDEDVYARIDSYLTDADAMADAWTAEEAQS